MLDQIDLIAQYVIFADRDDQFIISVSKARFGKPKSRGGKLQVLPTLTELIHGQKRGEIRRRGSLFEINETEENGVSVV